MSVKLTSGVMFCACAAWSSTMCLGAAQVTTPSTQQIYPKTAIVYPAGTATSANRITVTFRYLNTAGGSYDIDNGGEVHLNPTGIPGMPGQYTWDTGFGPGVNGSGHTQWTPSPPIPGMPGAYIADHKFKAGTHLHPTQHVVLP